MPNSDIQARKMDISRTLLLCFVLAAATFAAFEGVRSNDFVFYDDDKYITGNAPRARIKPIAVNTTVTT